MRLARLAIAAVIALGAAPAFAQQAKTCTKADEAAAAKAVDRVVTWPQLQKTWEDYRHCDSGAIDEAFTDAVLRMLVEWKNPEVLADAMSKEPDYGEFVVRHLKSPAAKDDRESVYSRAKASCPAKLNAFCDRIAEASKP